MGSPATIFSTALAGTTALANAGGTGVNTPQINYPSYSPVAPPGYVQPVINQAPPDATTFYDAQQMELQDYTNQADSQIQNAGEQMEMAGYNAYQTAFYAGQARESEALQYTASGVTLQGSPLLVLEQTRQQGLQEVQMYEQQGVNQAQLGYQQAFQTVNQGRAALLGQQMQFGGQVEQWGTQETVNELQNITQQQNQANQFVGQNTANIIGAYSQRVPVYQVNQNNALSQGLNALGQAFPGRQATVPGVSPVPVPNLPTIPFNQGQPSEQNSLIQQNGASNVGTFDPSGGGLTDLGSGINQMKTS